MAKKAPLAQPVHLVLMVWTVYWAPPAKPVQPVKLVLPAKQEIPESPAKSALTEKTVF
jgi:hypothetical protein